MSYQLTPEQESFRNVVRRVAREKIAPRAAAIDETDEFPWDVLELYKANNWLALLFPKELGGLEAGLLTCCLLIEEISRYSGPCGGIACNNWLGSEPLLIAGSKEQKEKYLPPIVRGEQIPAFALTERQAGSDPAAMQTRAVLDGDAYVLNGSKCFISAGDIADTVVVFAMTAPEQRTRGISAFIVEKGIPGFSVGRLENKMGMRGVHQAELYFKDCRIPKANLLGEEGQGFRYAMMTLDRTRATIGAQALGIAQGALDYAIAYAKERQQFGQPIADFQGIQWMLADMAIEVEAARGMVYTAATAAERSAPNLGYLSAISKCLASDVAMRVTTDAVQILGGYGYMKEHPVERMMRDAKLTQIYEGTNQIQRMVIARSLLR